MKTTFISGISLALFSMLILSDAFAQKTDYKNEAAYKFSSTEITKGLLAFNNKDVSSKTKDVGSETKDVGIKAIKYLNEKFYNAKNVIWSHHGKNLLAQFATEGTNAQILFDRKGNLIYSILRCNEEKLPNDIRSIIDDNYTRIYNTIISCAKVELDNRELWFIKLASKTNYVTAVVENGEIVDEIENYQRAN